MSVIIKGMELPECCEECQCYDWKEDFCRITGTVNNFSDQRVSDCPLSELPTPHGRLIDADKLIEEIKSYSCLALGERQRGILRTIGVVERAPTVIEAEVSENA